MNGFEIILPFLKPIEHLILDDAISEVMVNGHDHIFIEKAGFIEPVEGVSLGEKSLMVAVKNIARRLGDDISESKPILDSRLPDGSRVAAVIPPCSVDGVTLTIRKFNARHFGVEELVQAGTLERWLANQLEGYVLARKNILIAGSAGSGKTTLTNGILRELAQLTPHDRVLVIEDTTELQCSVANYVDLHTAGDVTMIDCLRACMRLQPTRIVVGEVRGAEAHAVLKAWNTGHPGGIATIHANDALSALTRLESLLTQSEEGQSMPHEFRCALIAEAIDLVVFIDEEPTTAAGRKVREVLLVSGYSNGKYTVEPV